MRACYLAPASRTRFQHERHRRRLPPCRTGRQRGLNGDTAGTVKDLNRDRRGPVPRGEQQPTTMTSRHKRPTEPQPFQLTTRDKGALRSVYRHRFLAAAHVHQLHFRGANQRVAQVRLRRLWAAGYLDRLFLPPEVPGVRDAWTGRPLYCLALRGAEVVADHLRLDIADIPHTPAQNRDGFQTMRHHLVFTDIAVAAEAADPAAVITREHHLRRLLHAASRTQRFRHAIMPDGAVTVPGPRSAGPQTFLFEIIRADPRGGNASVRAKFFRYRAALRDGFPRRVFGFPWIHAVVFLTPTWRRAEHLSRLARDVPGSERLLRFGVHPPTADFPGETQSQVLVLTPSGTKQPLYPIYPQFYPQSHV